MHLPRRLKGKGPLVRYVEEIARSDRKLAREVVRAVREVVSTPAGRIVLAALDEATLATPDPDSPGGPVSDRALREALGARSIPLDLQRLASDESEKLLREGDEGSG